MKEFKGNKYLNDLIDPEYQSGHSLICGKTGINNIVKKEIQFILNNTEDNIIVIAGSKKDLDGNMPGTSKAPRADITEIDQRAMPLGITLYNDPEYIMYEKSDYFSALMSCLTGKELRPELKSDLNSLLIRTYKKKENPTADTILSWLKKNIPETYFLEQYQGVIQSGQQTRRSAISDSRLQYLIADNPAKQLTALEVAWLQIKRNYAVDRKHTHLVVLCGDTMMYSNPVVSYFSMVIKRLRSHGGRLIMCVSNINFRFALRTYLSNMDSFIFLRQDPSDAEPIQDIFMLSDLETKYLCRAAAGHGLYIKKNTITKF